MKVAITSPVIHDGRELVVDDTPDLPKEVAEQLIACGAAVAVGKRAKQADDGGSADGSGQAEG